MNKAKTPLMRVRPFEILKGKAEGEGTNAKKAEHEKNVEERKSHVVVRCQTGKYEEGVYNEPWTLKGLQRDYPWRKLTKKTILMFC